MKGVSSDVQESGTLKELADELEMADKLESIECEANPPLTLLQRWRSGTKSLLEAHSLLVYHLKCIGMTRTSDWYFCIHSNMLKIQAVCWVK